MKFEWLVARRYLRSPHRPAVLRLVTVLSAVGVAAGVATLVIALAMNSGFRETLQDRLLGVTAHISLSEPAADGLHDYMQLAARLARTPGVRSTPAIYETVLLSAGKPAASNSRALTPSSRKNPTRRSTTSSKAARIFLRIPTASAPLSLAAYSRIA